ncbi:MAG TPA: site-2 protease family protein [Blastocatellia bacterium]|nr:site-2 protease family protein [Blastocatellia bacterium]
MNRGFYLGRIFGINIHIDASWILIFLLVTWSLASGLLPAWHPGWSAGMRWVLALVAATLFFASILLHELSHSIVAKAYGLPVRRITLFLFGGVSNIEREPPTPKIEFLMAVVGPITSILLGLIFLAMATFLIARSGAPLSDASATVSRFGPVTTLLAWLGPINILLGLFNLIPGFPLDGGRILRSILWSATKDLRKATAWATGAGRAVGWLFIISGVAMAFGAQLPLFGTGLVGGIWLIFIGWFLNSAAVNSYQQAIVRDLLEDVPVFRLMRLNVPTVTPTLPVSRLVYDYVMGTDERAFPVMDGERLVGLVTLDDIRKVPREAWEHTTVGEIMTDADHLDVVTASEYAGDALEKLTRRDVRQAPVVENGRLVGLLRRRDILKWLELQSGFALPGPSR